MGKNVCKTLCNSSCSCPLDSEILFNPWNNNLIGQGEMKILKIVHTFVKMFTFTSLKQFFHSRGQHLCKFIGTKESVCIRKEFNSHRTGLGHQYGHCFIVLGHQYGRRFIVLGHQYGLFFQAHVKTHYWTALLFCHWRKKALKFSQSIIIIQST